MRPNRLPMIVHRKLAWTQKQLAERAAIQRSYLGDLELGRRNPSVRTLVKVANALGVGVAELLEGGQKERAAKK